MPAQTRRHEIRPAPRHARRVGRGRTRALVVAAGVLSGTAFVAGPATAHEASSQIVPMPSTSVTSTREMGPVGTTDPVSSFQSMLDEAAHQAHVAQALAREQARREAAHKLARERVAKVRASRAALRSDVVRPVSGGYHLTARFGDNSSRWGSGRHTGLDFACSVGTPVHAVADGIVTSAGFSGAYGNRIEVTHADGTVTTYNHLSRIEVHSGSVKAGEVIGLVGVTGNTTGAHLHFEVMVGGSYVDPEHWLAARYVTF
jgi:murein DD-endopeptidase MepM/ murein hydrolase activator NlpD